HLHRPQVLPLPVLPKLKQLILNVGAWQYSCYLSLTPVVSACANLRILTIKLIWFAPKMIMRKVKERNLPTHQSLEVAEIHGYYGRTSDIELAMHFMKICVALKKLVIDPKSRNARRLTKEDMIKEEAAGRCCAHQQLKPITPVGLELVIL
ncbi:F-box/LRR-repeat protein-like protein, partial [Tanacetum coccineum]